MHDSSFSAEFISAPQMALLPAAEIRAGNAAIKSTSNYLPRPSFHVPQFTARPPRFRRLRGVHEHEDEPASLPSLSHSMSTISSDAESATDFILDELLPGSPICQSPMLLSSPVTSPAGPNTSELDGCGSPDIASDCGDSDSAAASLQGTSTGSDLILGWKPSVQPGSLVIGESVGELSKDKPGLLSGWKPSVADQTVELLSEGDLPPMSIECSLPVLDADAAMEWFDQIELCMGAEESWSDLDASTEDMDIYSSLAMPAPTSSLRFNLDLPQPDESAVPAQIPSTSSLDSGVHDLLGTLPQENAELASGIAKLMSRMIALNQQNAELQRQLASQQEQLFAERESHWDELARAREEAETRRLDALVDSTTVGSVHSPVIPLQGGEIGDPRWNMTLEDLGGFAKDVRQAFAASLAERAKDSNEKDIATVLQDVLAGFE
ncbi:unnamed protein product [Peniophora sp. CBMAI 1063]|nr:unnamed protein product [Peniophora sp. CBMAI 1063]